MRRNVAVYADHRRQSCGQMQVGGLVLDAKGQEFGNFHLYFSLFPRGPDPAVFPSENGAMFVPRGPSTSVPIMSPIEIELATSAPVDRCRHCGMRAAATRTVSLVAVSKTNRQMVRAAFDAGQRAFGENYAQRRRGEDCRFGNLKSQCIEWHFIGPLQSNKASLVAKHFDWVQSVDRMKIAEALSARREGVPLKRSH